MVAQIVIHSIGRRSRHDEPAILDHAEVHLTAILSDFREDRRVIRANRNVRHRGEIDGQPSLGIVVSDAEFIAHGTEPEPKRYPDADAPRRMLDSAEAPHVVFGGGNPEQAVKLVRAEDAVRDKPIFPLKGLDGFEQATVEVFVRDRVPIARPGQKNLEKHALLSAENRLVRALCLIVSGWPRLSVNGARDRDRRADNSRKSERCPTNLRTHNRRQPSPNGSKIRQRH